MDVSEQVERTKSSIAGGEDTIGNSYPQAERHGHNNQCGNDNYRRDNYDKPRVVPRLVVGIRDRRYRSYRMKSSDSRCYRSRVMQCFDRSPPVHMYQTRPMMEKRV